MSMHDNGYGRKAGPNPGSQTDIAGKRSVIVLQAPDLGAALR
jgi:hypothetical protein